MQHNHLVTIRCIWLLCLVTIGTLNAQEITPSPAFKDKALMAYPETGWLTNGGNLSNQRFSYLDEINTENVKNLKGVWRTHLNGSGLGPRYSGEAQPIVYEGVIYIVTGADDVFAISVETGAILWDYEANLPDTGLRICCGWTSRGVGMGDGKIYVGQLDNKLVALDQRSGEIIWSIYAEEKGSRYSITSAPLYYDGMVITGFAGADSATRGVVKAFDAKDGRHLWSFYTIPAPGEFGHDSWPDNGFWEFGGANVWQTPAVDPELGLIYFATANAAPDFNGSVRAGDNLFSASVLALDVKTGEYRWHYQMVHHDIWDYDASNPVILFDLELEGKPRQALAHAGKTGWVYILDRITGEPLIGIEERPVPQDTRQATSPTQPYPRGDSFVPQDLDHPPEGYQLVNGGRIFTPFWTDPVALKPGSIGGANWPPSSYDPRTNLFYVCASDQVNALIGGDRHNEIPDEETSSYFGGSFSSMPIPITGIFAAMDMKTNKLVWGQRWDDQCYSGSIATAGGLLFVGRNDGRLTAMDSSNGMKLWEFQTGAGVNTTASTFEYNDKQYVTVYSAGNFFAGSTRGDSVWLFSLDGDLPQAIPPGPAPPIPYGPNITRGERVITDGKEIYDSACQYCHGADGLGGSHGTPLTALEQKGGLPYVINILKNGGARMPAFKGMLNEEQINSVSEYINSHY